MLKVIQTMGLPASFPVHPSAEFEPGMLLQFMVIGNDIVAGISDGTAPFAIVDDARTNAFTKPVIDEIIQITVPPESITTDGNGKLITSVEVSGLIENPHIIQSSFTSSISVFLNYVNGIITVPVGTELNYSISGTGINDGFKIVVSYIYRISNKPGDDTTASSGRVSGHFTRGFYATDQYETDQVYPLNATLFCSAGGKFTTKQVNENYPGIALVSGPPTSTQSLLELMWL